MFNSYRLFVPRVRDSNPRGREAGETRSVFRRSVQGAKRRRSGARAAQPHAESLIAHHRF